MALTKIPSSLLDTSGGFDLGDSVRVNIGSDNDLALFHTGANGVIHNTTGALRIRANTLNIQDYTNEDAMITATSNSSVDLYHNNQKKFETSSTGATVTGVLTATSVNTGQGDYELYAMDQNVRTTDSPAFAAATINGTLTVTGDLDITGDINSYNVTDLDVTDKTITLGAGQTEANSGGSGIIIDGSSASILWDETNDEFDFNKNVRAESFSVGAGPTSELLFLSGAGHNGHGTTNARSVATFNTTGQSAGVWFGGRTDETTGIIGTRTATGNLAFETYNSGWGERMRITYDGKVGIGTSNPLQKLVVSDGGGYGFEFAPNNSSVNQILSYDRSGGAYRDFKISASEIRLGYGQAGANEAMRINSSGNVGINQVNPAAALDIKGDTSTYAGMAKIYLTDSNSNSESRNWSIGNGGSGFGHFTIGLSNAKDGDPQASGTHTNPFVIDHTGNVGIGESNPATKLHVYGTDPVIRVSDDGTSGFSTLELRQGNTANEGSELIYNSSTGHTHLNTIYGADLKIATNTGSFGTTGTNTRLTVKGDGVIEVGKSNVSTDRIKFMGNTNVFAPNTGDHTQGTRLSLYDANTTAWYAIGIESNHMWFNADDGGSYKFYTNGNQKVHIDCSAPMPEFRVGTDSTNAMRLGSITAVFPYSGPTLIVATPGAQLTVHNGTNSHTNWVTLNNSLSDYLKGTATFSTINTSQQANIIVYLNVATKVYLARQTNWNGTSVSGWTQISNDSTVISDNNSHDVYVRYLPAGTHSLDNDSALYFFEAPIGP